MSMVGRTAFLETASSLERDPPLAHEVLQDFRELVLERTSILPIYEIGSSEMAYLVLEVLCYGNAPGEDKLAGTGVYELAVRSLAGYHEGCERKEAARRKKGRQKR